MPHHIPRTRRPACAFTLIELLTVIAIIGILAAIIIPTVGKVREVARTSNTTSNLRQTGQALLAYVSENKDFLPGSRTGGSSVGVISAVNYQFERNPQGGGGYSDRRCRLGFYLAPYGGIKSDANGPVDFPMFADKSWESRMRDESTINMDLATSRNWAVIFAVNTRLDRSDHPGLPVSSFMPFGTAGGVGALNGTAPVQYSKLASFVPLSRTWFVTQADQDLDLVSNVTDNDVNAALRTPLFKTKRITVFFDGSVRPVKIDENMKGLL